MLQTLSTPLSARLPRLLLWLALGAATLPCMAQYKVVGPDGSVTYTDRPPANTSGSVSALGRRGMTPGTTNSPYANLPLELRQAAQRYPVTLYTSTDCAPCVTSRQWLNERGVPYSERSVTSEEDAKALERLAGGRSVPSLTIGTQGVRGFSESDWVAYLDAAGYPRESKLPRGWTPPPVAPLVDRPASVAVRPTPAAPRQEAPAPAEPPVEPEAGGVRF